MSPALAAAAAAAVLALAAGREAIAGARSARGRERVAAPRLPAALRRLLAQEAPLRIERAGLAGRLSPAGLVAAKLACAATGALLSPGLASAMPDRLSVLALVGGPLGAFFAPDFLIARRARARRAAILAALPDALDLLGVGVAAGRPAERVLAEIAAAGSGSLGSELAVALAEIECGAPSSVAMQGLARRVPGPELAGVAASLERSRRLGSPLAADLHERAAALRREARSAVEERAARAAPKIQLVVALLLVPSVLLMLLAALVAHAGTLLPT